MRKWMSAALGALIIACGGGGTQQEEGTGLTLPQPPQTEPQTVKVTGKVIGILTDSRGEPLTLEISQDTNLTLTFSDADGDGLYEGTAEGAPLGSGRIISVLKQDIDKNGIWDYMDIVDGDIAVLNSYELYHNRHLVPEEVQWVDYEGYGIYDMVAWPFFYRYWGLGIARFFPPSPGYMITEYEWNNQLKDSRPSTILYPQWLFFETTGFDPRATTGCPAAFGPIVVFRGPVYFIRDPDPEYEYLTTNRYSSKEPQFYFKAIRKAIKEWNRILRDRLGFDGLIFYGVLPLPKENGEILPLEEDEIPPPPNLFDKPLNKQIIEVIELDPNRRYSATGMTGAPHGSYYGFYVPFWAQNNYIFYGGGMEIPGWTMSDVYGMSIILGGSLHIYSVPPDYDEFISLLIHEFGHILGFGHPFENLYLDLPYPNRTLEPDTPSVMNYCDRANCTLTVSEEDAEILKYIYGWAKELEYPYILRKAEIQAYYFDNPYCNPAGEPYHDWLIELLKAQGSPLANR